MLEAIISGVLQGNTSETFRAQKLFVILKPTLDTKAITGGDFLKHIYYVVRDDTTR